MKKGIDISKWNGSIDFNKVKNDGIDFVIIRAGYGKVDSQKDNRFEEYYRKAKAVGLKVGCYFYSYATSVKEAKQEANTFLKWIAGKQFEYPVYFDIEDKSQLTLSKDVLTDICLTWCSTVEKAGYYVGIYSNPNWFTNRLDCERLSIYDKWLAHWSDKAWKGNEFGGLWQYSNEGLINGIKGYVDLDYSYRDYPTIIKKNGLNGFAEPKTVDELAREVIAGKWGTAPERKKLLEKAGYNYSLVQKRVNELLK